MSIDLNPIQNSNLTHMTAYDKLHKEVKEGKLKIYYVIALPRSRGTALSQALTQSSVIATQINEPHYCSDYQGKEWSDLDLNSKDRTIDQVYQDILAVWENREARELTGLVVHDLSADISKSRFNRITGIAEYTILLQRDLEEVRNSLTLRYANDQFITAGSDKLSTKDVSLLMDRSTSYEQCMALIPKSSSFFDKGSPQHLECIREKVDTLVKDKFSRSLSNLQEMIALCQEKQMKHIVFESRDLISEPKKHLRTLAEKMGITYNDRMVDDWHKSIGEQFNCCITKNWGELAQTNAWNGPARNSKRLELFIPEGVKPSP